MKKIEIAAIVMCGLIIFSVLGLTVHFLSNHGDKAESQRLEAEKAKIEEAYQKGIRQGRAQVYEKIIRDLANQKGLSFGGRASY